jgi:hypothetical protein
MVAGVRTTPQPGDGERRETTCTVGRRTMARRPGSDGSAGAGAGTGGLPGATCSAVWATEPVLRRRRSPVIVVTRAATMAVTPSNRTARRRPETNINPPIAGWSRGAKSASRWTPRDLGARPASWKSDHTSVAITPKRRRRFSPGKCVDKTWSVRWADPPLALSPDLGSGLRIDNDRNAPAGPSQVGTVGRYEVARLPVVGRIQWNSVIRLPGQDRPVSTRPASRCLRFRTGPLTYYPESPIPNASLDGGRGRSRRTVPIEFLELPGETVGAPCRTLLRDAASPAIPAYRPGMAELFRHRPSRFPRPGEGPRALNARAFVKS